MPNWIERIRSCGLTFIRKHVFYDRLEVYESLHKYSGMTLGKYLIIPVGLDLFMDLSADGESFRRFEDEVVSPFYFKLKGDWGWNLYVCFILTESEFAQIPPERLSRVERGKRFGKKCVISADRLSERLPMAKIPDRLDGSAAADPLQDWQQALAPEGLLFCLDNYSKMTFTAYVDSGIGSELPPQAIQSTERPPRRPEGPIASLYFGDRFRSHILSDAPSLEFAQVNLLAGPNGMGKTSVLESIELAFTGTIQRNLLADRTLSEDWNGRVAFAGDGGAFEGIPEEAEKKQRELVYYKHKVAPRGLSQLNRLFHQYNYFSSEAVHQFCYNPGAQTDYRAAFARVIYGEQLERFEQIWRRYSDEFKTARNSLAKELGAPSDALRDLERQGLQQSELMLDRAHADLRNIANWIGQCRLAYPLPDDDAGLEQIEQWLQHFKPYLHYLDVVGTPFGRLQPSDPQNGAQLKEQQNMNQAGTDSLRKQLQSLQEQFDHLPPVTELERELIRDRSAFEERSSELEQLHRISGQLGEYADLFDRRGSRERRKQIAERIAAVQSAIRSLADIWNLYGHLAAVPLPSADAAELRNRIESLEAERIAAKRASDEAAEQASEQRERAGKLQRIVSELKSYGRRYTHLHPDDSRCPLCGHDHETAQLLAEAVHSGLEADGSRLNEFMKEAEKLGKELQSLDRELALLREQLRTLESLAEARTYMQSRDNVESTRALRENSGLSAVQAVLTNIRGQIDSQEHLLEELQRQASALDDLGFTLKAIHSLETMMNDPILAPYVVQIGTEAAYAELAAMLDRELASLSGIVESARQKFALTQEKLEQTTQIRADLTSRIADLNKELQQLFAEANRLSELGETWSRLTERNVQLQKQHSWTEWRQYLQKLMLVAEQLGATLEPRLLMERQDREAASLAAKIEELTAKLTRCDRAAAILSELKSLTEYGDDFVRSNFDAISSLFVALHSPNEFERLEWTADNKIAAIRKGGRIPCAIHQMSTGQRTSVILAIFFIMHLVMDTAPRFLLLDEPVANMDELNVLGLLDFLRQLTVTRGTQLIVTTANPQIATLFRRKFSFLEHRFRTFNLRRDTDGPVRVTVQQFKPYQEKSVPLPTA